jgi:hypothetical protein
MILSMIPHPLRLCREALNRLESGVNSLAANNLDSPRVARALLGASRIATGTRQVSEKSLAAVYRRLALPTRNEVERITAAMHRMEDKLDLLIPVSEKPARAARPPRTRQPALQARVEPRLVVQKKVPGKRPAKPTANAKAKANAKPLPATRESTLPLSLNREIGDHVGTP